MSTQYKYRILHVPSNIILSIICNGKERLSFYCIHDANMYINKLIHLSNIYNRGYCRDKNNKHIVNLTRDIIKFNRACKMLPFFVHDSSCFSLHRDVLPLYKCLFGNTAGLVQPIILNKVEFCVLRVGV